MITLEQVEAGLQYLAETDVKFGLSKARQIAGKERLKTEYSMAYLLTDQGLKVGDRGAEAQVSAKYVLALKEYEDSVADYEIMRAKRLRVELNIEVWRSVNSARSKGIIV